LANAWAYAEAYPDEIERAIQRTGRGINSGAFYADEQYPLCKITAKFGHDVLTVQEAGKANQKIPDEEV
jgi:hypothetical protein